MISEAAHKTDRWSREAVDGYNTGAGGEAKLQLQELLVMMKRACRKKTTDDIRQCNAETKSRRWSLQHSSSKYKYENYYMYKI